MDVNGRPAGRFTATLKTPVGALIFKLKFNEALFCDLVLKFKLIVLPGTSPALRSESNNFKEFFLLLDELDHAVYLTLILETVILWVV